jgi:DNA-binding transcriptional ArsR family regulator
MEFSLDIKTHKLKKAELVLHALDHPVRQQILYFIHTHKEVRVAMILEQLHIEQTVTSQHLSILRKAGFVESRRDGKLVFYAINYSRLEQVQNSINKLLD